jgi:hypothetical protein
MEQRVLNAGERISERPAPKSVGLYPTHKRKIHMTSPSNVEKLGSGQLGWLAVI